MSNVVKRWMSGGALALTALVVSACVYDPYTGGYYPCCGYYPYGYPYRPPYPYPQPGYPYPPGPPPPQGSPQQYEPQPGPQGEAPYAPHAGNLAQRFAAANVTRDGRLTREQAQAAGWRAVARNFDSIDTAQRGYVTLDELRAWARAHHPDRAPTGPVG